MSQTTSAPVASPAGFSDVKGWFWPADQLLFDWFLKRQEKTPEQFGDLLELGAYLGKSAMFIGGYLRARRAVHGLRPLRLTGPGRLQQRRDGQVLRRH